MLSLQRYKNKHSTTHNYNKTKQNNISTTANKSFVPPMKTVTLNVININHAPTRSLHVQQTMIVLYHVVNNQIHASILQSMPYIHHYLN